MVDTSPGGDARIFSEPSPGHVVAGYRLDARKPLQLSRRPVPLHGRWEGGARGHALLGGRRCQRCRRNYLANNTNKPDLSTRQTLATNSRNRTIERRPSRRICRSKGVPSLEGTSRNDETYRVARWRWLPRECRCWAADSACPRVASAGSAAGPAPAPWSARCSPAAVAASSTPWRRGPSPTGIWDWCRSRSSCPRSRTSNPRTSSASSEALPTRLGREGTRDAPRGGASGESDGDGASVGRRSPLVPATTSSRSTPRIWSPRPRTRASTRNPRNEICLEKRKGGKGKEAS